MNAKHNIHTARIQSHLNQMLSYQGNPTTLADVILSRINDGWMPEEQIEMNWVERFDRVKFIKEAHKCEKTVYRLTNGEFCMKLSKIAFDFATQVSTHLEGLKAFAA